MDTKVQAIKCVVQFSLSSFTQTLFFSSNIFSESL